MSSKPKNKLTEQGLKFLSDPVMYEALSAIAEPIGVSPEEYLLRFEEVMTEQPEAIFGFFEKTADDIF